MIRSFRKFCSIMIENIFPLTSYIFIILSFILQFGAQNSMGIYRDLIYRNSILEGTILTLVLLQLYRVIALIGILICIVGLYFNKKNKREVFQSIHCNDRNKFRRYLWCTIGLSLVLIFMINFYDKLSWIAYPWMVLTVGIGVVMQYIRMIYTCFH